MPTDPLSRSTSSVDYGPSATVIALIVTALIALVIGESPWDPLDVATGLVMFSILLVFVENEVVFGLGRVARVMLAGVYGLAAAATAAYAIQLYYERGRPRPDLWFISQENCNEAWDPRDCASGQATESLVLVWLIVFSGVFVASTVIARRGRRRERKGGASGQATGTLWLTSLITLGAFLAAELLARRTQPKSSSQG